MRSQDDVFDGPSARTRVAQTTVWCGGCRVHFAGRYQHSIDGDADSALLAQLVERGFEAINGVSCPKCRWRYVIEAMVRVHLPGRREVLLVIPEGARHRVVQLKAEFLAEVANAPGTGVVPAYALAPTLVAGIAGLADALESPPRVTVSRDVQSDDALAPDDSLPFAVEPFGTPTPSAVSAGPIKVETPIPLAKTLPPDDDEAPPKRSAPRHAVAAAEASVDLVSVDLLAEEIAAKAEVVAKPVRPSGLLAQVLGKRPSEGSGEDRWSSVDDGWTLNPTPEAEENEEPTQMVRMPPESTPEVALPTFDPDRALGRAEYVAAAEELVRAVVKLDPDRAAGFVDGTAKVRFQLHEPSAGPVMMLLLERTEPTGESLDHTFWTLSPKLDREALDALAEAFTVEFQFFAPDGAYVGRRRLRAPLERNVDDARAVVAAAQGRVDYARASQAVSAPDYDRLGKLRHNFESDSFDALESAADARLALGIVTYWSAPERRDYLLRVQAFPRAWYDAIVRRVVDASVRFGLAMEPHMRQAAVDLEVVSDTGDLLTRTLANFAEVNLNLKPSGLDPLDIWDNWEALLAYAEELDVRVDADIEELAAQAMERAREAVQSDSLELDADDGSVELEEYADLSELSDEDLIGLLDDKKNRLEAALGLLGRGRTIYVPSLFDTVRVMTRAELLRMVPAALAMGPAFESSFIEGLNSRRAALRLASALFLSEIRSERAAAPLLALIPAAADAVWPFLARAAARMGRRIIGPVLDLVAAEGDPEGRLAETLALLGPDARPALAAAREQRTDARCTKCLDRALDRVGEVSFADAADFTERLEEAFAAAGAEEFGPDFEESIVSVELGPGSSVNDLEADVDFGSLDEG